MAKADILSDEVPIKTRLEMAPTVFELWASAEQYDITPAVLPTADRTYADRHTQAALDAWNAGAASVARMVTESTFETEALRERIQALAVSE